MGKPRYGKDVMAAIRNAEAHGFVLITKSKGRGRHVRMQHKENGAIIVFPATPSSSTWFKNNAADVKRYAENGRPTHAR
jgi:predicted RNA binding protein YcfA (HicA-like mRNA interferase family)